MTVMPLTGAEGAASFTGLPRKAVANEGVPSDLIRFAGGARHGIVRVWHNKKPATLKEEEVPQAAVSRCRGPIHWHSCCATCPRFDWSIQAIPTVHRRQQFIVLDRVECDEAAEVVVALFAGP